MSMDDNKVDYGKNNFKKFKKIVNLSGYEECEESQHSLYPLLFFLVFLKSNFFPDFLKEFEVHIVSMDDDKIEYNQK